MSTLLTRNHRLRTWRRTTGRTPTSPSRPLYGTSGACSCGWETRSNEAPSQGGLIAVRDDYFQHLRELMEQAAPTGVWTVLAGHWACDFLNSEGFPCSTTATRRYGLRGHQAIVMGCRVHTRHLGDTG